MKAFILKYADGDCEDDEPSECEEDNDPESELSDQEVNLVGTLDLSDSLGYDYLPSKLDIDLSGFIESDDYEEYDEEYDDDYDPNSKIRKSKKKKVE